MLVVHGREFRLLDAPCERGWSECRLLLVEPPTLAPETATLALGLVTEISPVTSDPPMITGVPLLLFSARILPW